MTNRNIIIKRVGDTWMKGLLSARSFAIWAKNMMARVNTSIRIQISNAGNITRTTNNINMVIKHKDKKKQEKRKQSRTQKQLAKGKTTYTKNNKT